eukprot:4026000-Pleurochrysis_carterae.AAC.1
MSDSVTRPNQGTTQFSSSAPSRARPSTSSCRTARARARAQTRRQLLRRERSLRNATRQRMVAAKARRQWASSASCSRLKQCACQAHHGTQFGRRRQQRELDASGSRPDAPAAGGLAAEFPAQPRGRWQAHEPLATSTPRNK